MSGPEIVVIGGANVDIKCRLAGPFVPGTSNIGEVRLSVGGVGRNIAENLARLGVPLVLLTAVGADADGDRLVAVCQEAGIDTSLIVRAGQPTGRYVAMLDESGELIAGVNEMAIMEAITPELIDAYRTYLVSAQFIIADANLPERTLANLANFSRQAGIRLVIDPVSVEKSARLLPLLDPYNPIFLMSPNRDQLAAITGLPVLTDAEVASAVKSLHARGAENIIVGLGPHGAYASDGSAGIFVPVIATRIEDVTGAGDAALAAAVFALLHGMDLGTAARAGQIAAKMTVECGSTVAPDLCSKALFDELARAGA